MTMDFIEHAKRVVNKGGVKTLTFMDFIQHVKKGVNRNINMQKCEAMLNITIFFGITYFWSL